MDVFQNKRMNRKEHWLIFAYLGIETIYMYIFICIWVVSIFIYIVCKAICFLMEFSSLIWWLFCPLPLPYLYHLSLNPQFPSLYFYLLYLPYQTHFDFVCVKLQNILKYYTFRNYQIQSMGNSHAQEEP